MQFLSKQFKEALVFGSADQYNVWQGDKKGRVFEGFVILFEMGSIIPRTFIWWIFKAIIQIILQEFISVAFEWFWDNCWWGWSFCVLHCKDSDLSLWFEGNCSGLKWKTLQKWQHLQPNNVLSLQKNKNKEIPYILCSHE